MAVFVAGSRCTLCGRSIQSDDAVLFPPFVGNAADPLYVFNDAAVHRACFEEHPLSTRARVRLDEVRRRTGPGESRCACCEEAIEAPDAYVGLGHLTDDVALRAHRWNYAQFHRRCVSAWPRLNEIVSSLEELQRRGFWEGDSLTRIIDDLRRN